MIYQTDYFGFVYEWYDMKTSMKYLGSHHGSAEDPYKGSNTRFQRAIKKRPVDFVRTILEYTLIDDMNHTLSREQKWLDSIENIKDNPNYYNQKNEACGGWSFITAEHVKKRASTLKDKHSKHGLTEKESKSYKIKIENRLERISKTGFTDKEKEQHSKYGYLVKVISLSGVEKIYNSCGEATRDLGIDAQYGIRSCKKKEYFKGYKITKLRNPIIDCRVEK